MLSLRSEPLPKLCMLTSVPTGRVPQLCGKRLTKLTADIFPLREALSFAGLAEQVHQDFRQHGCC
jgi:hypothetical protein